MAQAVFYCTFSPCSALGATIAVLSRVIIFVKIRTKFNSPTARAHIEMTVRGEWRPARDVINRSVSWLRATRTASRRHDVDDARHGQSPSAPLTFLYNRSRNDVAR